MFFPTLDSIATKDVLTIDMQASVQDAIAKMCASNHRNIIVCEEAAYYVLTTVDLISLRLQDFDFQQPLSALSLKQVPTMPGSENVINAINIINKEHEYICLINGNGNLIGIVTNSDIVASVDPQIMLESTSLESLFETRFSYTVIQADAPVEEAIGILDASEKDCLIVAVADELVGIVTSKDILRFFNRPRKECVIGDFMSSPLQTLPLSTSIKDAIAFVKEKHFKRVVVIDEKGALVGIVSQQDLIAQSYMRWSNLIREHYHEIEELSALLEQQNKQLVTMATRDRLTGVSNRHAFEDRYERESAYAKRYNGTLHLVLFDIDRFKNINDTYGHLVGDKVLQEFSALVDGHARRTDSFARWGGEEFILLLQNSCDDDARKVAEKFRRLIEEHRFHTVGTVTCSIGLCRVEPGTPLAENFAKADKALYHSKNHGRNRVTYAGEETPTSL